MLKDERLPTVPTLLGSGGGYMSLPDDGSLNGGALPSVSLGPPRECLSELLRLADVVSSTGLRGTGGLLVFLDETDSIEVGDEDAV